MSCTLICCFHLSLVFLTSHNNIMFIFRHTNLLLPGTFFSVIFFFSLTDDSLLADYELLLCSVVNRSQHNTVLGRVCKTASIYQRLNTKNRFIDTRALRSRLDSNLSKINYLKNLFFTHIVRKIIFNYSLKKGNDFFKIFN